VADKSPILELLLNFKDRVHRVIVKENNTNELLRIVSQSDMLQFIQARLDTCGDVRPLTALSSLYVHRVSCLRCVMDGWQWKDKPLSELKAIGESPIVSVNTNSRALFAFIQMHTQGVSAVAVVDSQGILVGSISVRYASLSCSVRYYACGSCVSAVI
jgi:CBS-domain-containing membrane protein